MTDNGGFVVLAKVREAKAGLLLTTEVMVAEAPKEEYEHPPMGGGGMGGMDM